MHGSRGLPGAAPKIAIGAAIVALLTSVIAVIVVVSRGGGATSPAAGSGASREATASEPARPAAHRVAATDLVKLRREAVAVVREAGKALGVRVVDDGLREALDLGPDDVITELSGRAIERELDVFEAMLALRRLRASTVYVELLRDGRPASARWKIDGDLQAARAPDPYGPSRGLGSSGSLGSSGRSLLGIDPVAPDPLADTIERIDDLHYEVPRSTIERVLASPSSYARVARTLPAPRTGGFYVLGVRPGTLVAAIGIASGDVIRAINGNGVSSIQEAIDLYPQIKNAREWRIDLHRRGRPVLITIAIK